VNASAGATANPDDAVFGLAYLGDTEHVSQRFV
jgi:hypothetical protein